MVAFLTSLGYDRWVVPVLLLLPALGAAAVSAHGMSASRTAAGADAAAPVARRIALGVFVLELIVSAGLWWLYGPGASGWRAVVDVPWIASWGIRFSVGIDGISLTMVLLTTFIMPLAVLGGWTSIRTRVHTYHALLMILTAGMLGVFVARDLFLFYVMWEVMLVPMYLIIGMWGGERRIYASIKFFLYTLVGSLLMLVAILWLGVHAGTGGQLDFAYDAVMASPPVTLRAALLLFGAFFVAFAVKVPMFPFHTWLPDAHVEAPTAGSVILASIMLKMGTYGFLRFAIPLLPAAAMHPRVRAVILTLAVIGVIYGSLVALVQPDFKKLVAYSSVAHLGMVMLGIFALTRESVDGAILIMIGHGISTGGLFLLIGMIYERRHTRLIEAYGGLARAVPLFSTALVIVSLSSIGLPGTNGFVAEFLTLIGSFRTVPGLAVVATVGVILAAAYLLWALQRILFGALDKPENAHLTDLNWREMGLLVPLVVVIVWLGVYPAPVLDRIGPSTAGFVHQVESRAGRIRPEMAARPLLAPAMEVR